MSVLIRGKTEAEKFASIEKVLQNFRRRLGTKVIGMMPPVVITHEQRPVTKDGLLFRAIMPLYGRLSFGCMYLDTVLDSVLQIELTLSDAHGDHTYVNNITGSTVTVTFEKPIAPGDIVTLRMRPACEMPYALTSLLVTPNSPTKLQPTEFMLEQFVALDKDIDEPKEKPRARKSAKK